MTPAALLASARSLIEDDPEAHGLVDLCDLIGPTFVDGGAGGDSVTIGDVATDVKCLVEPAGQGEQIVVGGETFIASHRLYMIKTTATEAITPRYKLKVHARNGTAQMIFENPVIVDESLSPLITVKSILVKQGYQS